MVDKKVRMTVEFSVDEEALQEHGVSAEKVLKHLTFDEDDVSDGFRISTDIPGLSPVSNFFLCDGKVVSQEFAKDWEKGDGVDWLRRMVVDEIDINGVCYGLVESEKKSLLSDFGVIDRLAKEMEGCLRFGDRTEYDALEIVFQKHFPGMIEAFRGQKMVDSLGLARGVDAKILGESLFVAWNGAETEICLDKDGLYCRLPGEELYRPLRGRIQHILAGDAFFDVQVPGRIQVATYDAHQNYDEDDEPWIVYDEGDNCFFEEDIEAELYSKVRALLEHLTLNQKPLEGVIRDAVGKAGALSCGNTQICKDGAFEKI